MVRLAMLAAAGIVVGGVIYGSWKMAAYRGGLLVAILLLLTLGTWQANASLRRMMMANGEPSLARFAIDGGIAKIIELTLSGLSWATMAMAAILLAVAFGWINGVPKATAP